MALPYFDNAAPFYTEATQKIDGTTSFTVRKYYDGLGQLVQTQQAGVLLDNACSSDGDTNPNSCDVVSDTWYDAYGQAVRQSVPYTATMSSDYHTPRPSRPETLTAYDILGRTLVITNTDNTMQTFGYSDTLLSGVPYLEAKATDAKGNATLSRGDLWGRAARVIPASGPGVAYGYDAAGRLITTTYGTAETFLDYDLAGRKKSMDDPDMGVWEYTYNGAGGLVAQEDARGCTTLLGYDPLNRLRTRRPTATVLHRSPPPNP